MKKRIVTIIFGAVVDLVVTAVTVKVVDWFLYRRKPIGFCSFRK